MDTAERGLVSNGVLSSGESVVEASGLTSPMIFQIPSLPLTGWKGGLLKTVTLRSIVGQVQCLCGARHRMRTTNGTLSWDCPELDQNWQIVLSGSLTASP